MSCCRKKDESQENNFKDVVSVCLLLINTTIRDVEKGTFPKSCLLNVEFPTSLLSNKVCKLCYILDNFFTCFGVLSKCCRHWAIWCTKFSVHDNILAN